MPGLLTLVNQDDGITALQVLPSFLLLSSFVPFSVLVCFLKLCMLLVRCPVSFYLKYAYSLFFTPLLCMYRFIGEKPFWRVDISTAHPQDICLQYW